MATAPQPAEQISLNTMGRLSGALINPRPTFEDVARRPSWIAPIVLLCLVNIGVTGVFGQRVGWRSFMEKQFANNPRIERLTPDQRQQALDRAVKFAPVIGYVGGVAGIFVAALAVAGIMLGAFNLLSSADLQYKASLGIVSHAWMPAVVGGILGILVLFLKDPSTVDLQHLVASNLGAALSGDSPKWLEMLATSFDLFTFWSIFLLAVGFSAANPKRVNRAKALGIVIALWAVYVLVKVGWAAVFS